MMFPLALVGAITLFALVILALTSIAFAITSRRTTPSFLTHMPRSRAERKRAKRLGLR